ncbi:MAG: hypothetical protein EXQ74_05670 [Thermoleophilia bacterium]|nr:hypothetical protein [Thermoleophilia bacterium]
MPGRAWETATTGVEPGNRWQNPYVESSGARLHEGRLNQKWLDSRRGVQVLAEEWRTLCTTVRPHSAPDGLTATEITQQVTSIPPLS